MKKETPKWRAHHFAQLARGPIPHLASATNYSVYGEVDLTSHLGRRSRKLRQALRVKVPRDVDGAFRVHNRLDEKHIAV